MAHNILNIAAFSDGEQGGNPAGVWIGTELPDEATMQRIAHEVGFSETVFAASAGNGWRVRYFSPESEVPFCGHATIALGAALALAHGDGLFELTLNHANITVEGKRQGSLIAAALQSPTTHSEAVSDALLADALALFGLQHNDLDPRIAPAIIHGGAKHLVLSLKDRETLRAMHYDLDAGRRLMNGAGMATILLAFAETNQLFHTRNPFASGGVYEDPATGAATAAFAGYLRDIHWPHQGKINIIQGEDMGCRSLLQAEITSQIGASIRVSGSARIMAN
ncbi:PhzF family phenazine biosynthesis protein [Solimicrobium silvestre]|uniref:Phenazine biosynthesis protein, PhzF family n=1 Tax=Solimicrobium silvestre TaxID=2099400 RepID=A0A2S9GVR9_9BURK|nr:PhzF family phenazine biosynthesis protein [Solimicrobium silvestre]PRC91819.1 Phenazine biosynthesis protein, PhzF family [Solimicrobium silvestre]